MRKWPLERLRSWYRHRFTDLTDALIPVYDWGFRRLGDRKHEAFRRRVVELADLKPGACSSTRAAARA